MNKKIFVFLTLILMLASVLRLWQLGKVPISPDWDEVALGYNAYSLAQTGKDEYGKFLPVILRSFDDYKPALYAYFTIPSISIFDLNVVSVRLPSAIFGILTVLAAFFLVKELFVKNSIALLSSFLLAISPWHIQFSRIAFESNVGVALNIFATLFFIKSFKKPWFLFLSALMFGLSIHVYQSEKVFVPLILAFLVYIFRRHFFSIRKRYIILSFLILSFIALPVVHFILTNSEALSRAKGVSIFSDLTLVEINARKLIRDQENNDLVGLILDNRRTEFARKVISGYLSHFDLNWLFITGDIARHHAPNMGLLYLWELPFLLIGIYGLIFGNFDKKIKYFIFAWILITPIPASITSGVPHSVRTLNFLPMLQIIIAIGLLVFISKISKIKYQIAKIQIKYLLFAIYFLFLIFNISYYFNQYFVQQNYFSAYSWQYGYEKLTPEVIRIGKNYKKIVISNTPPMDQSYVFFLFYTKYPPLLYQMETGGDVSGGFRENHKFDKYEFRPINWSHEKRSQDTLFVGVPEDFSDDANIVNTIFYPDGEASMQIATQK